MELRSADWLGVGPPKHYRLIFLQGMYIIMYIYKLSDDKIMDATFTELRNHAKTYFDAVERGEVVRVYRNGKPVAEIIPINEGAPSWKRQASPLSINGLSLSHEILNDRMESV